MAAAGNEQEARAKDFVRRLGYAEVITGESNIKKLLQIRVVQGADSNCADIVGFKPGFRNAVAAIICESKGTDVSRALVQLGNVAAALFEHFAAVRKPIALVLLVYRSSLRELDIGNSPGPGYLVGEPDRVGMRPLVDAGTQERKAAPASATVDVKRLDVRLTRWVEQVAKLPVYVYSER